MSRTLKQKRRAYLAAAKRARANGDEVAAVLFELLADEVRPKERSPHRPRLHRVGADRQWQGAI